MDDTTPDFDAIARRIVNGMGFSHTFSDITTALRRVWNARGDADAKAVNHELAMIGSSMLRERDRQYLREAIRAKDR
jgi:hypothetical protein